MKFISIITPCYNEEENVEVCYSRTKAVMEKLKNYKYEHIFIDNSSTDKTVDCLKQIAKNDKNVKIIINSRNFGHIRSPYYGLLQGDGDANIMMVSDLQDPPEVIEKLIKKWEDGFHIVVAVKNKSLESRWMFGIRKLYYTLIKRLSDVDQVKNFTGFGLYDRKVINLSLIHI